MATVSVVIPVYNAVETLGDQLEALCRQTYRGEWEVIVADNGSTDGSREVATRFLARLPNLRILDASSRPGAAAARNIGASVAKSDLLVFCDADDLVTEGWLTSHVDALSDHDFVSGAMDHHALNPGVYARWQRSHVTSAARGLRYLPYALSSNMGVTRKAFEEVGGFAEDLGTAAAGDDVDLSWRLQLAGYKLHFDPSAVVAYRHRRSLRALWRQHAQYGMAEPVLFRRFRGRGLPRVRVLGMARAYLRLIGHLHWLLRTETRGVWVREAAKRWGRVRGSLRARVLYL
jgi:GT2 family glycosyltransferase